MMVEEAAKSPYQNVITRGVGVEEDLQVERITHEQLKEGDVLFLCSDGLYRSVAPEAIAKTPLEKPLANKAAERLIEMANEAGGPDNISIALYRHVRPVYDEDAPTIKDAIIAWSSSRETEPGGSPWRARRFATV